MSENQEFDTEQNEKELTEYSTSQYKEDTGIIGDQALVTGILAVVFSFCFGLLGLIFGIAAIVMGIRGKKQMPKAAKPVIAIALGVAAIGQSLFSSYILFMVFVQNHSMFGF